MWTSVLDISSWEQFWEVQATPAELQTDFNFYERWLSEGGHANMTYLQNNLAARKDARKILAGVKCIISLIIPYAEGHSVRGSGQKNETQSDAIIAKIARYARVPDYHRSLKREIDTVLHAWQKDALSQNLLSQTTSWRVVTDSLPFLDRAHARLAGLGFVGKNTMLIRPGVGSFFFIAHALIDAPFEILAAENLEKPLAANAIAELSCGECRKCLDACPTGALIAPMYLQSDKCLSYLTIESRAQIPSEFIPHLGAQFYGCDICQDVCPYNLRTTPLQTIKSFEKQHDFFLQITLEQVAKMSQAEYEKWFGGTAMTRAKYSGLVRNALCALYATRNAALSDILLQRRNDAEPLIAATAHQLMELNGRQHVPDPQ
ncbi:MAG: tRNA epoxyqueuosine(34) reductase QueG [Betaproteobacteria bacterium]|nr:tRNA epoxyqueuosine(34) reductase QueG [Betaproteobacteria bacterium]